MGAMDDIEKDLYGDESPAAKTKRIFETNAPFAAAQIIDLSQNSMSDTVKLRASQYVVDRVLGPVGSGDEEGALDKFLKGIENLANEK